ncbi:Altered inheritance of mitochondria protein 6 [Rhodotorula mucilaginosa]|uniref:Altered inheritance of mitochondria protein 6 n=1 Tax=Rhodotorula mucilaginosa TaxID=5537 RepID=A0A9P6W915_RHOMI|nr:Altered inheritance of mitochondria protein 6 [Rhodotorula mucilaginosa]
MVSIPFVLRVGPVAAVNPENLPTRGAAVLARSTLAALSGLVFQSGISAMSYPTDVTREILPKNIHSHNDYWRKVPLFDALSVGCKSVEADVHLIDGELLVGHTRVSLSHPRSLNSLYLDPIMQLLRLQNPTSAYSNANASMTNGVFDMDPSTSLQLIIDYKTEGNALHAAVIDALAVYRSLDLLTHVDMTNASSPTLNVRPLTVVCSGNCPLAAVDAQTPIRDVFLDAPLIDIANSSYTRWNSMLASTSYRKMAGWGNSFDVDGEMAAEIKTLVQISRDKGIPSRFWETPGWPGFARDKVWEAMLDLGVDWINADNLKAASEV